MITHQKIVHFPWKIFQGFNWILYRNKCSMLCSCTTRTQKNNRYTVEPHVMVYSLILSPRWCGQIFMARWFWNNNYFKYNCSYTTLVKSTETLINNVYYKHFQEERPRHLKAVTDIDLVSWERELRICVLEILSAWWGVVWVTQEVILEGKCWYVRWKNN